METSNPRSDSLRGGGGFFLRGREGRRAAGSLGGERDVKYRGNHE